MAVIRGLEALTGPCAVELFSDSQYVVKAIDAWMPRWKAFGWKRSKTAKQQVKNVDLWVRLDGLLQVHTVHANWVRGHVGHRENERCDELATAAAAMTAVTPAPPIVPRPGNGVEVDSHLFEGASSDDPDDGE